MKRFSWIASFLVIVMYGGDLRAADIVVTDAWVRATPGSMRVSAGYAHIANAGSSADNLVAVSITGAASTSVHQTTEKGGMEAVDRLTIPANGSVDLKPGSYHIMIMGLPRPLQAGESLPLEFTFERAGKIAVEAKVAPLAATQMPR